MTSFEAMVAEARAAVDRRASCVPLTRLRESSRLAPGAISALSRLRTDDRAVTVIAEVKRSTATFADLSGVGDPGMLACFYAAGGAACVSVVTGPSATRGSLKDLDAVRAAVELPVLANDLVVTRTRCMRLGLTAPTCSCSMPVSRPWCSKGSLRESTPWA